MNRVIWEKKEFDDNNPTSYPCPFCRTGVLVFDKLVIHKTPNGIEMEFANYSDGIEYVFSSILKCKNIECNEVITMSGQCLKDIRIATLQPEGQYDESSISTYRPKYFYPNLIIFPIEKIIPLKVKEQLNLSFSHYFNDLSSCANRIRNAIELILDDLKAPKKRKTKAGKILMFQNLDARIKHFSKRNVKISKLLLALKIIGNEGSHVGTVKKEDILNAFEILELLIEYTYLKENKRIFLIAEKIIDNQNR